MNEVSEYPVNIYVGITDKCNANCIMCWRRMSRDERLDMSDKIVDEIKTVLPFAEYIGWWGDGEFFSYGNIDSLIEFMQQHPDTRHGFSTNAIELAKYAHRLSKINISEIHISIDGALDGTLKRIRRGVTMSNIIDGVKSIYNEYDRIKRKRPVISFCFVAMCSNIYELPLLVELAARMEVYNIYVLTLNPSDDLRCEYLPVVAPGVEKHFFDLAKAKADKLNITLTHMNPDILEECGYETNPMYPSIDKYFNTA